MIIPAFLALRRMQRINFNLPISHDLLGQFLAWQSGAFSEVYSPSKDFCHSLSRLRIKFQNHKTPIKIKLLSKDNVL
jgi:hypothetical protein